MNNLSPECILSEINGATHSVENSKRDVEKVNERKINRLTNEVTRSICTGQVIISLAGACRELIDNALDAGATNIEIRLKENGIQILELIDNGSGISEENFDLLCKPHSTSKLSAIEDFNFLSTFGFRGEALNALAALSELTITTRHSLAKIASRLCFDRNGNLIKKELCPRQVGTTITVTNIFATLPVRRQELVRNSRREFLKMLSSVQSFALSRIDCRFNCCNAVNGKRIQILSTPGNCTQLKEVILSLFGVVKAEKGSSILVIDQAVPDAETLALYGVKYDPKSDDEIFNEIKLSGYVSSCEFACGRNSADRQFIYINKRPVDFAKLNRITNEVYSHFNRGQYCMLVLFIEVDPAKLDVNVSPDKRTVFLQNEKELFAKLRASLMFTFSKVDGNCRRGGMAISADSQRHFLTSKIIGGIHNERRSSAELEFLTQMSTDDVEIGLGGYTDRDASFTNLHNSLLDLTSEDGSTHSSYLLPSSKLSSDGKHLKTASFVEKNRKRSAPQDSGGGDFDELRCIDTAVDDIFAVEENEDVHRSTTTSNSMLSSDLMAEVDAVEKNDAETDLESNKTSLHSRNNSQKASNLFSKFFPVKNTSQSTKYNAKLSPSEGLPLSDSYQQFRDSMKKTLQAYEFQPIRSNNPNTSTPLGTQKSQDQQRGGFTTAAKLFRNNMKSLEESNYANAVVEHDGGLKEIQQQPVIADTKFEDDGNKRVENSTDLSIVVSSAASEWTFQSQNLTTTTVFSKDESIVDAKACTSVQYLQDGHGEILRPQQTLEISGFAKLREMVLRRKSLGINGGKDDGRREFRCEIESLPVVDNDQTHANCSDQLDQNKTTPEAHLNLMLNKSDFAKMEVIGQFNNAFIFTRLNDEMFMIDQHASDEKFNFERFKRRAQIATQKLISTKALELGAIEESILRDNVDVFRANGFDFIFNDGAEIGRRVLLSSVPVLHGWQFDNTDIEEIVGVLADFPGVMYRPVKLRKIFASRACRKSVMFGNALTKQQMHQIVCNMGTMEQPWNCPHGRPTIRHLCTIRTRNVENVYESSC